jgi:hypothetical protein
MGYRWDYHKERLGEWRLIDFAGEEQVGFGGRDIAYQERYHPCRREVESGEDSKGVGGITLDAGYCGGQTGFVVSTGLKRYKRRRSEDREEETGP